MNSTFRKGLQRRTIAIYQRNLFRVRPSLDLTLAGNCPRLRRKPLSINEIERSSTRRLESAAILNMDFHTVFYVRCMADIQTAIGATQNKMNLLTQMLGC
jgi:hypothetical protein